MNNDWLDYAQSMGFGDIHFKLDEQTGLQAIIAIHSTKNGPALGGCRCIEYPSTTAAVLDVLNLARAMSYKSAVNHLPFGGGKSVLIKPKSIPDRNTYFKKFGQFVDELNGRYIAAVDSGTSIADMLNIRQSTSFVTSVEPPHLSPSPYTALGVQRGIEAAVAFKLGKTSLDGVHVAIQGTGEVGCDLAVRLRTLGARVTMTDINTDTLARCAKRCGAELVAPNEIFSTDCDVFAPCALGGVINPDTIEQVRAPIVAGAANNPLTNLKIAQALHDKDILYAPDYVINAGGLIKIAGEYDTHFAGQADQKIHDIYDTLMHIFQRAEETDNMPITVAGHLAEERL